MEVGRHLDMINMHITVGSNSYENMKPFTYLAALLINKNYIHQTYGGKWMLFKPNRSIRLRWARHEGSEAFKILSGRTTGLRRPKRR